MTPTDNILLFLDIFNQEGGNAIQLRRNSELIIDVRLRIKNLKNSLVSWKIEKKNTQQDASEMLLIILGKIQEEFKQFYNESVTIEEKKCELCYKEYGEFELSTTVLPLKSSLKRTSIKDLLHEYNTPMPIPEDAKRYYSHESYCSEEGKIMVTSSLRFGSFIFIYMNIFHKGSVKVHPQNIGTRGTRTRYLFYEFRRILLNCYICARPIKPKEMLFSRLTRIDILNSLDIQDNFGKSLILSSFIVYIPAALSPTGTSETFDEKVYLIGDCATGEEVSLNGHYIVFTRWAYKTKRLWVKTDDIMDKVQIYSENDFLSNFDDHLGDEFQIYVSNYKYYMHKIFRVLSL